MTINFLSVELEQDEKRKAVRLFQNEAAVVETQSKGCPRCDIWERERGSGALRAACAGELNTGVGDGGAQWLWVRPVILSGPCGSCLSPNSGDSHLSDPVQLALSTLSLSCILTTHLFPIHLLGVSLLSFHDSAQSSSHCLLFLGEPIPSFFMPALDPYIFLFCWLSLV